jgi:hypothetical protein
MPVISAFIRGRQRIHQPHETSMRRSPEPRTKASARRLRADSAQMHKQRRAGGWRSGRPTSQRRREVDNAVAAKVPGFSHPEPDPVEAWIRERSFYDRFDDRANSSAGNAEPGS